MKNWRYYLRLPLLPILFVWLLGRNMFVLNRQAWRWTVDRISEVHDTAKRNFKPKERS